MLFICRHLTNKFNSIRMAIVIVITICIKHMADTKRCRLSIRTDKQSTIIIVDNFNTITAFKIIEDLKYYSIATSFY